MNAQQWFDWYIKHIGIEEMEPIWELGGAETLESLGVRGIALEGADWNVDLCSYFLHSIESNSVGSIRAKDFLEHIPSCSHSGCPHDYTDDGQLHCVTSLIKEVHRILKPGGKFISLTPSTDGRGAFQDPTHVSFWNENSFWYYTQQQCKFIGLDEPLFEKVWLDTRFLSDHDESNNISYVFAVLRKPS